MQRHPARLVLSTTEAEYAAMDDGVNKALFVRGQLV